MAAPDASMKRPGIATRVIGLPLAVMTLATGATAGEIHRSAFGTLANGTRIEAIELRNAHGVRARVITLGATLQSLVVPDRSGRFADVVLGYATLEPYVLASNYFGATIGRYANRIAQGRFTLDGRAYRLAQNNGVNALHGGVRGFDQAVWAVVKATSGTTSSVTLRHISADGDGGYPGTLTVDVTYTLDDSAAVTIDYRATVDTPTVVNLTNHSFFNLAGEASGRTPLAHRLMIFADAYTPVDAGLIPTGEIRPVDGSPFDFRRGAVINSRIRDYRDAQLVRGRGFDHNYVLPGGMTAHPRLALRLEDAGSGRTMEVLTTEPGVQFYSGNFLDGAVAGKGGKAYRQGDGLAFEAQHFPDSPNRPAFPSTRLDPGQTYRQTTIYRFGIASATSAKRTKR